MVISVITSFSLVTSCWSSSFFLSVAGFLPLLSLNTVAEFSSSLSFQL
ncbi:MAG: hypothetical protein QW100_01035 [Thermoplasmatales archaeon]